MEIIRRAHHVGVLSHYCKSAQRCLGDRGIPDLALVGMFGAAWAEVKTPNCPTLSPAQTTWKHALIAAGQTYYVVWPVDLDNGKVDRILDGLAQGAAAA